ncbi:TetR/AcrR family transcriptional regulator [Polaromonas sp. UBA4122]|uniref:TetR/AcrR family transcriptional regulator n=1 Tax=Polaromonas sp. UBA4122 TaxID=1947074 RepID=UPI0025CD3E15|nr:TetR/AcrR family transcriptional regulator [Polaromonas sp. UBA4122]
MSVSELPVKTARPKSMSGAVPKSQHKGQQTKAAIVDAALGLATQIGLEGLSIGALAEVMRMSKSGVFAHFGSREELQISVIREYHARFEEEVFFPALQQARGLPRLRAMFHNWMIRTSVEIDSGCLYISGAVEFDDRPGPVRDALAGSVRTWLAAMYRAVVQAKEAGHLRDDADEQQMAFEIHGLILALHYEARFLKNPGSLDRANTGFANILARYGSNAAPALAAPVSSSTRSPANSASPKKVSAKANPSKPV